MLYGSAYWGGLMKWIEETMMGARYINDTDLKLLHLTDSPAEIVEIVVNSQDSLNKIDDIVYDY